MVGRVYLHIDMIDAEDGTSWLGWVAATDAAIAFANVEGRGQPLVGRAFASVRDRFPDAREILVSASRDVVLAIPTGEAALDGGIISFDATGIAHECRAAGVRLTVRWLEREVVGVRADDFLMGAARAVARAGAHGIPLSDEVAFAKGWRSRLLAGIGGARLNYSVAGGGLGRTQASKFIGIPPEAVDGHVLSGRLGLTPDTMVSYATAIRLRDALELAGETRWEAEELGAAHLRRSEGRADATLCVSTFDNKRAVGVGMSLRQGDGCVGWSWKFKGVPDDGRSECVRAALVALAMRLGSLEGCAVLDVVCTDPWLAKVLEGAELGVQPRTLEAVASVRSAAAERNVTIRTSYLRFPYSRPRSLGELHALARSSSLLACMAAAGTMVMHRASSALSPGDGLLARCEAEAAGLRRKLSGQDLVVEVLFRGCGVDEGARIRFERLLAETEAGHAGISVETPALLPWSMDGRIAVLDHGRPRAVHDGFMVGPDIMRKWAQWHERHALIRAGNPILRLRKTLFALDDTLDLRTWPEKRYADVLAWVQGRTATSPFHARGSAARNAERRLLVLAAECGGWPFTPPGSTRFLLKERQRMPPPADRLTAQREAEEGKDAPLPSGG